MATEGGGGPGGGASVGRAVHTGVSPTAVSRSLSAAAHCLRHTPLRVSSLRGLTKAREETSGGHDLMGSFSASVTAMHYRTNSGEQGSSREHENKQTKRKQRREKKKDSKHTNENNNNKKDMLSEVK